MVEGSVDCPRIQHGPYLPGEVVLVDAPDSEIVNRIVPIPLIHLLILQLLLPQHQTPRNAEKVAPHLALQAVEVLLRLSEEMEQLLNYFFRRQPQESPELFAHQFDEFGATVTGKKVRFEGG
jgi:hypothetical protein